MTSVNWRLAHISLELCHGACQHDIPDSSHRPAIPSPDTAIAVPPLYLCTFGAGGRGQDERFKKTAIVTGAAQGIRRRTAEVLAQTGYAVVLADLRPTTHVADALRQRGASVLEFRGDISDEKTVAELASRIEQELGDVDLLVDNAGISSIHQRRISLPRSFVILGASSASRTEQIYSISICLVLL